VKLKELKRPKLLPRLRRPLSWRLSPSRRLLSLPISLLSTTVPRLVSTPLLACKMVRDLDAPRVPSSREMLPGGKLPSRRTTSSLLLPKPRP